MADKPKKKSNKKVKNSKKNIKSKSALNRRRGSVAGISIALAVIAVLVLFFVRRNFVNEAIEAIGGKGKVTLNIWYSDESLTDYLNSMALSYYDEKGVKVVPVYHSQLDYIEAINKASIEAANPDDEMSETELPDLYIVGTDEIEKAAMAGLAIPVSDSRKILTNLYFPETALNAVNYRGEYFGYPFFYETSFLLYNETYLKELAALELKAELANQLNVNDSLEDDGMTDIVNDGDPMALPEGVTEEAWINAVDERVHYLVPKSIQDLLSIANTHSSPEGVESFLCWDVSDIFFNYFFTGAYMNIGGEYGDDRTVIDICNEDTIGCMTIYQSLNQYFSIDSATSDYADVINRFIAGEYIYTIATTDVIARLETAKARGEFNYDYGIASLPSVDNAQTVKGLSYTTAVIVNGYTLNRRDANDFAAYLTYNGADSLYERTGKLPASNANKDYDNDKLDIVKEVYANSLQLPKIVELSNFWLELEQAYTLIWDGDDPEKVLSDLEERMRNQLRQN